MASAATVFTQDNLRFINGVMQAEVYDLTLEAKDGIELFIKEEEKIVNLGFDERRRVVRRITEHNGTIITMPDDGIPTGNTKFSDGDSFEEAIVLTEKVGEATIIERNIEKLNAKLSTLNFQHDKDRATGRSILMDMGWFDILKNTMMRKYKKAEKDAVLNVFNGLKSKTIYGTDIVVANSGTLLGGDNLITQSFSPELLDLIMQHARGMKTIDGYGVGFSVPKYFFTTLTNLADAIRMFAPNITLNDLYRNLYNYFNSQKTLVDAVDLNANFSLSIGAEHGVEILSETKEPRFLMNPDKYGNYTLLVKKVFGVGVVSRAGLVQIDHA